MVDRRLRQRVPRCSGPHTRQQHAPALPCGWIAESRDAAWRRRVVGAASDGATIARYDTAPPATDVSGHLEAMANYAGQSAGVIKEQQPAAAIVREVSQEAERILVALSP